MKTKMKTNTLFILIVSLVCTISCKAQVSVANLNGTSWKMVSPVNEYASTVWTFSKTQVIDTATFFDDNEVIKNYSQYYLSKTKPASFNNALVGKSVKGDYLVTYSTKRKRMDWYTIMSLDLKKGDMYLFREQRPDEIGGCNVTIHFKLISK